ncbi:MAG: DUF58 domain-containing protein [Salibacteraceae bacterium]
METSELLKRVRKIEIKTRGLSNQIFSGEYHSAFKGRGMTFSEVREYAPGDPIRAIDWNVTARFNQPYVKVFEEEREITMMLILDLSASGNFGSKSEQKRHLLTEIAAVLAFSGTQNNDKVGAILFTDTVEKYIPPKKGRSHVLRIIRELINYEPHSNKTNIKEALKFFNSVTKKRSIAFLISDFIDSDYDRPLQIASTRHDLVSLIIRDRAEEQLPTMGLIPFTDFEGGGTTWIDTSNRKVREEYAKKHREHMSQTQSLLRKKGVDFTEVYTGKNYVKSLMRLFKMREARR